MGCYTYTATASTIDATLVDDVVVVGVVDSDINNVAEAVAIHDDGGTRIIFMMITMLLIIMVLRVAPRVSRTCSKCHMYQSDRERLGSLFLLPGIDLLVDDGGESKNFESVLDGAV